MKNVCSIILNATICCNSTKLANLVAFRYYNNIFHSLNKHSKRVNFRIFLSRNNCLLLFINSICNCATRNIKLFRSLIRVHCTRFDGFNSLFQILLIIVTVSLQISPPSPENKVWNYTGYTFSNVKSFILEYLSKLFFCHRCMQMQYKHSLFKSVSWSTVKKRFFKQVKPSIKLLQWLHICNAQVDRTRENYYFVFLYILLAIVDLGTL